MMLYNIYQHDCMCKSITMYVRGIAGREVADDHDHSYFHFLQVDLLILQYIYASGKMLL